MNRHLQRVRLLLRRLPRPSLSETNRFLLIGIVVGVGAGLLVVIFHNLIELVSWFSLGLPIGSRRWSTLLAPVLGGMLAVWLVQRVWTAARGSGIVQTKAALVLSDGEIPAQAAVGKLAACSLSIGSGNALGPEDPALHMGAAFASTLGRALRLNPDQIQLLPPIGAAAGIAAAFNTPIMAVLFVIEEILGGWNSATLGSIVLASVSAVVTSRAFLGDHPLFQVPAFDIRHPSELILYLLMGLAAGLLASLFTRSVIHARVLLTRRLGNTHRFTRAACAGLFVGLVGLWFPQVMGAGYFAVDGALHDQYAWQTLLAIGLLKVLVTAAAYSAGIPGGMFAPTLFIGAMIGGGLGALSAQIWPVPIGQSSAFVLVGMGTFFAAVFRCPITSIFMAFEVSASYRIILPVMVANMAAYLIARRLQPMPFFERVALLEGVHLPSQEELRELRPLRVQDVMIPGLPTSPLVYDPSDPPPHIFPDQPLEAALRLFQSRPTLAVVSRRDPTQILGVLHLRDCLQRYGLPTQPEGGH